MKYIAEVTTDNYLGDVFSYTNGNTCLILMKILLILSLISQHIYYISNVYKHINKFLFIYY